MGYHDEQFRGLCYCGVLLYALYKTSSGHFKFCLLEGKGAKMSFKTAQPVMTSWEVERWAGPKGKSKGGGNWLPYRGSTQPVSDR